MPQPAFIPYRPDRAPSGEIVARAERIFAEMDQRRSVRMFSPEPVPREAIELAIRTASTAPSGAHRQPWTFVVIDDPEKKRAIREAAEEEERTNYEGGRLPDHWLKALEPLGTDWHKEYLETAPWIVVIFEQRYGIGPDSEQQKNFYVKESVGIACGLFIAAIHQMGLATLTHTPSPMAFLTKLLERPKNERPFALLPIGYPAADCEVPDITRKDLNQVMIEFSGEDDPA
jgi:nitroreductase